MGRFYSGDIEGKFWFGIQDSNDIENLVNITSNIEYAWKVCNFIWCRRRFVRVANIASVT